MAPTQQWQPMKVYAYEHVRRGFGCESMCSVDTVPCGGDQHGLLRWRVWYPLAALRLRHAHSDHNKRTTSTHRGYRVGCVCSNHAGRLVVPQMCTRSAHAQPRAWPSTGKHWLQPAAPYCCRVVSRCRARTWGPSTPPAPAHVCLNVTKSLLRVVVCGASVYVGCHPC